MYSDEQIASLANELQVDADDIQDEFEKLTSYDVGADAAEPTIRRKHGADADNIFNVRGVGTLRGHFLLKEGYDTVEALATAEVEELAEVKYLSSSVAESIIEAAIRRLRSELIDPTEEPPDGEADSEQGDTVDIETQINQQTIAEPTVAPFTTGEELIEASSPSSRDDEYPGSCGFVFDPDAWPDRKRSYHRLDVEMFEDEIWRCPHEAPADEPYCIFHQNPERKSNKEVVQAFLEKVTGRADERVEKHFVGARFGNLDLNGRIIDPPDNYQIVIQHCTFEGEINLGDVQTTNAIDISHSRLDGGIILQDAVFDDELRGHHCHVDSTFEARDFRCAESVRFSQTIFNYGVRFNGSEFADLCSFTGATFESYLTMNYVRFSEAASFLYTEFDYRTEFNAAVFEGPAQFIGAHFDLDDERDYVPEFENVRFEREAIFGEHDRYDIDAPEFNQCPTFDGASFHGAAIFEGTKLLDGAEFTNAGFERGVDFSDTEILGSVEFAEADIAGSITFSPRSVGNSEIHIDFTNTSIAAGSLDQPADGRCFFDCSDAELGDVIVTNECGNEFPLDYVRMLRTEFDGFDFMRYRAGLEKEQWKIHTFEHDPPVPRKDIQPLDRELTYLRAKSGANLIGDGRAASGFFKREMRARRDRFRKRANHSSGLLDRFHGRRKQIFNWLFDAVCRYGEGPIQTGKSTVALMGIFAVIYAVSFPVFAETTPYEAMQWPVALEYMLFSVESFVAFVHNPAANIRSFVIRFVSVFEGFLGAFFIALFLFTLTRYVHR